MQMTESEIRGITKELREIAGDLRRWYLPIEDMKDARRYARRLSALIEKILEEQRRQKMERR